MSIWIFDGLTKRLPIFALLLFLVGCDGVTIGLLEPTGNGVRVANGDVTIAGPAGYCVDQSATRDLTGGAFVLLGSCASIANDPRAATPMVAGALTASVSSDSGANIATSIDRLGAFFQSNEGRAALARDGKALSVSILSSRRLGKTFFLKLRDTSQNEVSGISQDYWRALFDMRGRIVTLNVFSFQDRPMSDTVSFATLARFVRRIRRENPEILILEPNPL